MAKREKLKGISHILISGVFISVLLIVALVIKNNSVLQQQSSTGVLRNLITNSGLVVLILSIGLSLSLYWYRKNNAGKISYLNGLKISTILVFGSSLIASIFQLVYTHAINTNYVGRLKAQEAQFMKNLGIEEEVIQSVVSESYGNWSLFSNTFSYFFLIGLFVAILVTAYAYKTPLQSN